MSEPPTTTYVVYVKKDNYLTLTVEDTRYAGSLAHAEAVERAMQLRSNNPHWASIQVWDETEDVPRLELKI